MYEYKNSQENQLMYTFMTIANKDGGNLLVRADVGTGEAWYAAGGVWYKIEEKQEVIKESN